MMKKTLIAVAALAATGAMADLKITGTFDPVFSRITTNPNDTVDTVKAAVGNDGLGTQGVKFAVTEDLDGGMQALGMYEHNFSNSGGTSGANGAALRGEYYAGLKGDFGTIRLGSPNTVSLSVQQLASGSFGTKLGGRTSVIPGAAGTVAGGLNLYGLSLTRFNSSVQYISPNISGLTATATYVPGETVDGDVTVGSQMDLGAVFAQGPLAVGASYYSVAEVEAGANVSEPYTQLTAGARYNLGVAVVGAGFHQFTYDKSSQTGMRVAVDFPLSEQLTLTGTFQNATFNDEWGALDDEVYTQFAVGAQYKMSKTTTAYGRFVNGSAAESESTGSGFLVGLLVNF